MFSNVPNILIMNLHLLKKKLTVEGYEELLSKIDWYDPISYFEQMPAYVIARCPICLEKNIEKLDTYSMQNWRIAVGKAVFDHRTIVHYCKHFTLVQTFFHFHNIWPAEARGMLGPEVPHVIGHLLENGWCRAVIHALPVCRIEDHDFVPRYTIFMVSYFSEQPEDAYQTVIRFNVDYVEPGVAWPFIAPPDGYELWWDLNHWVSAGQLLWLDSHDPEFGIRTGDIDAFPYRNISGRTWPYLHIFPYPLPKPGPAKSKWKHKSS